MASGIVPAAHEGVTRASHMASTRRKERMKNLLLWIYCFVVIWFTLNLAEGTIELLGLPTLAVCVGIRVFGGREALGYEPRHLIDRKPQGIREVSRRDLERGKASRRRLL